MAMLAGQKAPVPQEQAECSVLAVEEAGLAVYLVAGQMVASTAAGARSALLHAVDEPKVVLDLSDLTFVDEVGLGVLAGAVRRVHEAGGGVVICARPGPVTSALRASGIARLVPVLGDLAEAKTALSTGRVRFSSRR
ncbi:MAG TPA: STAS domain-containing protein [Acidimicrobiales bacterium]|nr:STAS domain-containing protein [Acidimicrobiales bacterium]